MHLHLFALTRSVLVLLIWVRSLVHRDLFSHSITMEWWKPARLKTAKFTKRSRPRGVHFFIPSLSHHLFHRFFSQLVYHCNSMTLYFVADPKGGGEEPGTRTLSLVHFFHFHAVFSKNIGKIIGFYSKIRRWVLRLGKSWIRHRTTQGERCVIDNKHTSWLILDSRSLHNVTVHYDKNAPIWTLSQPLHRTPNMWITQKVLYTN